MATYASILVWRIPWTEEPARLQSMEPQRVRHDWVTGTHSCKYRTGERPLCRHQSLLLVQMGSEWCQKEVRRVGFPKHPSVEYGRASGKVSTVWILHFQGVGVVEILNFTLIPAALGLQPSQCPECPLLLPRRLLAAGPWAFWGHVSQEGARSWSRKQNRKPGFWSSARIFSKGLSRLQVATYYWVIKSI